MIFNHELTLAVMEDGKGREVGIAIAHPEFPSDEHPAPIGWWYFPGCACRVYNPGAPEAINQRGGLDPAL